MSLPTSIKSTFEDYMRAGNEAKSDGKFVDAFAFFIKAFDLIPRTNEMDAFRLEAMASIFLSCAHENFSPLREESLGILQKLTSRENTEPVFIKASAGYLLTCNAADAQEVRDILAYSRATIMTCNDATPKGTKSGASRTGNRGFYVGEFQGSNGKISSHEHGMFAEKCPQASVRYAA